MEYTTEDVGTEPKVQTLDAFNNQIVTPKDEILAPKEEVKPAEVDTHGNVEFKAPESTQGSYSAGASNARPKKKNLAIDMSKPYLYPLNKPDGEPTDYGQTMENVQTSIKAMSDGASPDEIYKDNFPLKVQTYKYLTETKGANPRDVAKGLGLDYELIQSSQDSWDRYKKALHSQISQIGTGFLMVGNTMPTATASDDAYVARAREETDKIVKDDKESKAIYDVMNAEYNEVDGSIDSPWNLAAMGGDATLDLGIGAGAAVAAKGTTATVRALREAYINVAAATTKEAAKFGYHQDPAELATGVLSAMAAESVGGYLAHRFMPKVNEGLQTKDVGQLQDMLDGMSILKKYNIEVGEEDLLNPEEILTRIKAKHLNPSELERITSIYTKRNISLMKGINRSLESIGITDPRKLEQYANGEIPLDRMGPEFKEFIEGKMAVHKAKMDPVYESLETLDINPSTGNQATYSIEGLTEQFRLGSGGAKAIYKNLKSEIDHIFNTMDNPASIQAKEIEAKLKGDLKLASANLIGVDSALNKVDDTILDAQGRLNLANARLAEAGEDMTPSKRISLEEIKRKAVRDLGKHTKARRSLKAQRREANKRIKSLKKQKKANRSAVKLATEPTHSSIMQVNEVRKYVNGLLHNGGTMFDTTSPTHKAYMNNIVKQMDEWMDNIPTDEGKLLVSRLRYANKLAKEGFDKWGDGAFKGITKALDSDNPDALNSLFKGENARFHLENLGKVAGKDSELYAKAAGKFLHDKIMNGVTGQSGVTEMADINWEQMANNLRSPEVKSLVKDLMGDEALKEINGMTYIAGTLGKHVNKAFESIAHTQAQKKHILRSIYDGTVGDMMSTITAGIERYSGHTLKTKFYGGKSNKGKIKAMLDNSIADIIQQASAKTIIGVLPNNRYSVGEAVQQIEKELAKRQGKPNATIEYVKKLINKKDN